MAGQELKATDKVVLKNSRDGAVEKNLADGSTTRVSSKVTETVLKPTKTPEQLDKIKATGLSPPEPRKRVYTNLKFGVNNPEKPVANDEDNQQSEQTVSAFIPPVAIRFKPKKADEKQFGVQAVRQKRKQCIRKEKAEVKEKELAFEAEKDDTAESVNIPDEADVSESKMRSEKTRNTLKEHSAVAEKLTDNPDESGLNFENDDVSVADKLIDTKDEKKLNKLSKKIDKDEKKFAKADKKLAKTEKKLPHQTTIRRQQVWNDKKGKVQHKLVFEKELKPIKHSGLVTKGIKGTEHAVKAGVSGVVHSQISKYEDDNSALKAAHSTEKVAESALHTGKSALHAANENLKTRPQRKVSKLQMNSDNAHSKLNFHKALSENKELRNSSTVKQAMKKSQMKRQYTKNAKTARQGVAKAQETVTKLGKKLVEAATKNKVVLIILIAALLLFGILAGLLGSCTMMMSDGSMSVFSTTYTAEDADIYAAEDYMKGLESALQEQINNIPNNYVGYDEYRYHLDEIKHDPYGLISYLTAENMCFVFDDSIKQDIQDLFNSLYTLSVETIHEVRSYQYTTTDEDGNTVLVTVYYDYYICDVTLTANDFNEAVKSKLEALGVYDLYELLLESKGNRPELF